MYDILKPTTALIMPGVSAFVIAVGQIWNWEQASPVAQTITAANALLGILVVAASGQYKNEEPLNPPSIGVVTKVPKEDGSNGYIFKFDTDPEELIENNKSVRFDIPE